MWWPQTIAVFLTESSQLLWSASALVVTSSTSVRNWLSHDGMSARRLLVWPVLLAQHGASEVIFAREHQNCKICLWCLFSSLMTAGSRKQSGEAVVKVVQLLASSSVTDLRVALCPSHLHFTSSTLTAVMYPDEIPEVFLRAYVGAVGPSFSGCRLNPSFMWSCV